PVCEEVFDLGSNGQISGIEVAREQLLAGSDGQRIVGSQLFDKTSPLLGKVADDDMRQRFAGSRSRPLKALWRTCDYCRQGNLMGHIALLKSTFCPCFGGPKPRSQTGLPVRHFIQAAASTGANLRRLSIL